MKIRPRAELKFPVSRRPLPPPKRLSMDEYVKFVELHRRYTLDQRAYEAWKRRSVVKVPFVLK